MEKAVKRYMPIFVLPTFFAFILGFYHSVYHGDLAVVL